MADLATTVLAQWRADAVGIALISVVILALFGGAEVVKRARGLPVEWTRKGTHVGAGAVVLAFPWLVVHTSSVVLLGIAFLGVLFGGKVTGLLGSIHDVERRTGGAYYYPVAVVMAWVLSGGDALLYMVPLAVMAIADTGAALVGQRAGETRFSVLDGTRSVEGSLAFFSLAFAVVLLSCSVAGRPGWPDLLLVTLVAASLTTAVEAVSVRGSDNLLIPYAAWMALDRTLRLGLTELGDWIIGMGLGLFMVATTATFARLSTAGSVLVFLLCTLAWALGGAGWFLPLWVLWATWLLFRPDDLVTELEMVFPSNAGSLVVLLLFAHTGDERLYLAFLATVAASGAVGGFRLARHRELLAFGGAGVGVLGPALCALWLGPEGGVVVVIAASLLGMVGYRALRRSPVPGRRLASSLLAGAVAWWAARWLEGA